MSEDFFKNRLLGGVNRDLLTILAQTLETDNTVSLGKEGIVGADTHVLAGVNVRAALTHQNVAGGGRSWWNPYLFYGRRIADRYTA